MGDHIRNRRWELNLFQKDLVDLFGVTEETIWNWENNETSPSISYYPKIILFLGSNPLAADPATLTGRMKNYRMEYGLSQEDLAKLMGVNESTVFHWENGGHKPLPSKLRLLENLFNTKELS